MNARTALRTLAAIRHYVRRAARCPCGEIAGRDPSWNGFCPRCFGHLHSILNTPVGHTTTLGQIGPIRIYDPEDEFRHEGGMMADDSEEDHPA